ncbi:MAG: bifunctional 3-deoxy-7-phosphoheptulonate synthase/chorismate mutase type II [Bacteroidales bacterium]|jgi:chorismate mutase|nr:bifunctional 3-deoxy-7-phosphoheptulonate synthase/chorismate mutase type II [Bacteroidales bacterium]
MFIKPFHSIKREKPLVIAGPCSAESYEQVLQTAESIAVSSPSVHWFRAGVWKSRTRPSQFEGIGSEALKWLSQIKALTGLKVCTEVIKPEHIELCLKHGIDGLWIGARTSTNPFMIEELAKCLQHLKVTKLPLFVKNPLNPDVNLWIGAMERFYNVGCEDITAVHRGFSLVDNGKYRQKPLWQVPIELKRLLPDVSVLCDPSHIAGERQYVYEISQMAMDLSLDGLMIEVHHNPEAAKTDSNQQITPDELKSLLEHLNIPNSENRSLSDITAIRERIDFIDDDIMDFLQKRMAQSEALARIKHQENMSLFQPDRWQEVLNDRLLKAKQKGLSQNFIKIIFEQIHEESIKVQSYAIKKNSLQKEN